MNIPVLDPGRPFIVRGFASNHRTILHCFAFDRVDALRQFQEAFTPVERSGMVVEVLDCEEQPWYINFWKWAGYLISF